MPVLSVRSVSCAAAATASRKNARSSPVKSRPPAGPNATIRSPSVSISAMSTPSIEVPLINPIAFIKCSLQTVQLEAETVMRIRAINPVYLILRDRIGGAVSKPRTPPLPFALTRLQPPKAKSMTKLKSDFINVLQSRGYVHQCTDLAALDALAAKEKITGYIGFDCTAPGLHIGNLIGIMMMPRAGADRASADCADGRRHDEGRRPLRKGREPQALDPG